MSQVIPFVRPGQKIAPAATLDPGEILGECTHCHTLVTREFEAHDGDTLVHVFCVESDQLKLLHKSEIWRAAKNLAYQEIAGPLATALTRAVVEPILEPINDPNISFIGVFTIIAELEGLLKRTTNVNITARVRAEVLIGHAKDLLRNRLNA